MSLAINRCTKFLRAVQFQCIKVENEENYPREHTCSSRKEHYKVKH